MTGKLPVNTAASPPFGGINIDIVEAGHVVRPMFSPPLTVTEDQAIIVGNKAWMTRSKYDALSAAISAENEKGAQRNELQG